MHPLLDDYLCKKYPKIFRDRQCSPMESCMHWGICVGDGWFSLIDTLCGKIQQYIDQPRSELNETTQEYKVPEGKTSQCPQVVAHQVKEKFGSLRFYFEGGDEHVEGMIELAEELSYTICEDCGDMGHTVGRNKGGWIHTSCLKCSIKNNHITNGGEELSKIWEQVIKDNENMPKYKYE